MTRKASSGSGFSITLGTTPLHEWSAWGRDLYLTFFCPRRDSN